jgi:diguanylate cyclase (GGDEF)-like protein/hemerythrin-like metal-binding protein/PAS domain S-box-containing protein
MKNHHKVDNNHPKESREALKLKNYMHALESLKVGIWEWDIEKDETTLSDQWYLNLGYTKDDFDKPSIKTLINNVFVDDQVKDQQNLQRLKEGLIDFYSIDIRVKHKSGQFVWIRNQAQVIEKDLVGVPTKVFGLQLDVSDHYRRERLQINAQMHDIIEHAPFPVIIASVKNETLVYGNQRSQTKFGFKNNEGIGLSTETFYVDLKDREVFLKQLKDKGFVYDFETQLYDFNHKAYWALMSAAFIQFNDELSILVSINDIDDRKKIEIALNEEKRRHNIITESISDVIWVHNIKEDRIDYVSPNVAKLFGFKAKEMLEARMFEMLHSDDYAVLQSEVRQNIDKFYTQGMRPLEFRIELQQLTKNNQRIWVEHVIRLQLNDQKEVILIGVSRNIDDRRKTEQYIDYLNRHDQLTGLYNKTAFHVFQHENQQKVDKLPYALLFIDFDNFKMVNDVVGHAEGDSLLVKIAQKLKEATVSMGILYRYEGDEFLIYIENQDENRVLKFSKELLQVIATEVKIQKHSYLITASIGVAVSNQTYTPDAVLKNASTALYLAKRVRNTVRLYSSDMDQVHEREALLEKDLIKAIELGQLIVYYQPIYDVRLGKIAHAEALLRWKHPDLGWIYPNEFIPLAEKSKLIIPMTEFVYDEVLKTLKKLEDLGYDQFNISVNFSVTSFANRAERLLNFIHYAHQNHGVHPSKIRLEITESMIIQETDEMVETISKLKEMGLKLELDDFGTGYSTFGKLKELPLDLVKIDKSLIDSVEKDPKEKLILDTMITVLHGLKFEVVIEGLERLEQFETIVSLQPDYIQGYLFSKAIHFEALVDYLNFTKDSRNLPVAYRLSDQESVIHWRQEYNTGIEAIDDVHRQIYKHMSYVQERYKDAQYQVALSNEYIEEILKLFEDHFSTEEKILKEYNYNFADYHAETHERIWERMLHLWEKAKEDPNQKNVFFEYIIQNYLIEHIGTEDMLFVQFFKNPQQSVSHFSFINYEQENLNIADAQHFRRKLNESTNLQKLLSKISSALMNSKDQDMDDHINEALRLCGEYVDADRAYVFDYDWENESTSNTYEWCSAGIEAQISELQNVPLEGIPDWVNAHIQGKAINVYDVRTLDVESNLRQILEPQDIWSILTVPMMDGENCVGFIGFDSVLKHHIYSDFERIILQEVSNVILSALKRKRIQNQLNYEKELYQATITSLLDGLAIVDPQGRIYYSNIQLNEILGYSGENLVGANIQDVFKPKNYLNHKAIECNWDFEKNYVFPDNVYISRHLNEVIFIEGNITKIHIDEKHPVGYLLTLKDVTERYESQKQSEAIFDLNLDMLCIADLDGNFIKVNNRFSEVLGYDVKTLTGIRFLDLVHQDDLKETLKILDTLQTQDHVHGFINRYKHLEGGYRYIEWNARKGYGKLIYATGRDVTHRIDIETINEYNAYHDVLTDLYNRRYVEERLKQLEEDIESWPISIISTDIDGLKTINDTLGHMAGDEAIQSAANHLRKHCRPTDILVRWGGDEFMVVLLNTSYPQALKIADRLQGKKTKVEAEEIKMSVGVATKTKSDEDFPSIIRLADERMYAQKRINKKH